MCHPRDRQLDHYSGSFEKQSHSNPAMREVVEYLFKEVSWSVSTSRVKDVWGNIIRLISSRILNIFIRCK